jgi:1-deoxy-D-xylulose-5-phosphate reductoisomerase
VYNAANEVAVEAFLESRLGFAGIPLLVDAVLDAMQPTPVEGVEHLVSVDAEARIRARETVGTQSSTRGDRIS